MIYYIEPCKGQLLNFTIDRIDLSSNVQCIRVFESVSKSYLTAQVIIYDNANIIENINGIGNPVNAGDPASLSFWSPPNLVSYDANLQVLKCKGEQVPDTLKFQIYYLDLIGMVFYQDRVNNVREISVDIGTNAITMLWNKYLGADPLSIKSVSTGMIGSQAQPYTIANQKPLTAISGIMKYMTSSYNTGEWFIYRDRFGVNLDQLEPMLKRANAVNNGGQPVPNNQGGFGPGVFVQKETWGAPSPQDY